MSLARLTLKIGLITGKFYSCAPFVGYCLTMIKSIVIRKGEPGAWDGGGVASPGAACTTTGSVIVGYAAERAPDGGINRGIAVAIANHPL